MHRSINIHDFADKQSRGQDNDSLPPRNNAVTRSFRPFKIALPETPQPFESQSPPSKLSSSTGNSNFGMIMPAYSKSSEHVSSQGKLPGSLDSPVLADRFLTPAKTKCGLSQSSKSASSIESSNPAKSDSPEDISDCPTQALSYEQMRELNIKRNKARLLELGLAGPSFMASTKKGGTKAPPRPKKRSSPRKHQMPRRSSRLSRLSTEDGKASINGDGRAQSPVARPSRLRVPTYSASGVASIGGIGEVASPVIDNSSCRHMMTQREKADRILAYAAEHGSCADLTKRGNDLTRKGINDPVLAKAVKYFRDDRYAPLIIPEVRRDLEEAGFVFDASHNAGCPTYDDLWMEKYNEYLSKMDENGKLRYKGNKRLYDWFYHQNRFVKNGYYDDEKFSFRVDLVKAVTMKWA